jgi:hypothetical protein
VTILNNDTAEMVSSALRVTPLYVAEMVTEPAVGLIATLNAPAELNTGTLMLAGTVANAVLLLVSVTNAPPAGVGAVKKSVADELVVPVCTSDGSRKIESNEAVGCGGGGVVVSVVERVTPLYVAEITEEVVVVTGVVDTKVT